MTHFELPPVDDWTTLIGKALGTCEVYFVACCCGMEAYDIRVDLLQGWRDTVSQDEFEQVQAQIADAIERLPSAPDSFYFLDEDHGRSEVLTWFQAIQQTLASTQPRAPQP